MLYVRYFDVVERIKIEFDRENISIPYPQSDVHLLNQSEGCIEKTLFTCLPVEFEKITHGKGVSPQVTLERP